jgi:hypothetical protein
MMVRWASPQGYQQVLAQFISIIQVFPFARLGSGHYSRILPNAGIPMLSISGGTQVGVLKRGRFAL